MEGLWSVQQITLYWTFTTSANIYHMTCFHLLLFWHSEVHNRISYKLLTNFELTNFNQLPPSFSVLLFAMCDFGLTTTFFATVGEWCKRVFFSSFFELRLNAVFDLIMWWLFFTRLWMFETILQPSKRFSSCEKFSPLGFCLLTNHSSCRDWITDKYIGAYFWFWITSSIASWFIFISL